MIFFREVIHSITITVIVYNRTMWEKSENFSIRKLVQFMCELVFYCGLCLHSCIHTKRIKWNLKRYIYRKSRYICRVFVVNEKHMWKVCDLLELQSQSVKSIRIERKRMNVILIEKKKRNVKNVKSICFMHNFHLSPHFTYSNCVWLFRFDALIHNAYDSIIPTCNTSHKI